MLWVNHQLLPSVAVLCYRGGPAGVTGRAGAVLPDLAELGLVRHRGVTHWPYPYLVLLAALWFRLDHWLFFLLFSVLLGALAHIDEDALSIPWAVVGTAATAPWRGRVGSRGEDGFVLLVLAAALAVAWRRGFLELEHLTAGLTEAVSFLVRAAGLPARLKAGWEYRTSYPLTQLQGVLSCLGVDMQATKK